VNTSTPSPHTLLCPGAIRPAYCLWLLCLWIMLAATGCSEPPPPPAGEVRLDILADTTLSAYPGEQDANLGGAPWMKAKSYQEFILLRPDTTAVGQRTVEQATLHVKLRGDHTLRRVSISTVPEAWNEGRGNSYDDTVAGAASFDHASHDNQPWTPPDGNATTTLFGIGDSEWHFADATPPDNDGWQRIAVDPGFVEACAASESHGIALMDDVGSEWSRTDAGRFNYTLLPNRYLHSRQSGRGEAPYLTVKLGAPRDTVAAKPPQPHPSNTPPAAIEIATPSLKAPEAAQHVTVGKQTVTLIDPWQRIDPHAGPSTPWVPIALDAEGTPLLAAARNEHVALALVIEGDANVLDARLRWPDSDAAQHITVQQHDAWPVRTENGWQTDALLPINHAAFNDKPAPRRHRVISLQIGPDSRPGTHDFTLQLRTPEATQRAPMRLRVWPFTLPDTLSFVPQLNSYSQPQNPANPAWHRLAHAHRCVLNRLPYNWRGQPNPHHAPTRHPDGSLDFSAWLDRVGPLLDGSAFADLPRGAVPVEFFYLPLSESWPVPFDPHYDATGDDKYWIDRATDPAYFEKFTDAARAMLTALHERGYDRTVFEFYLNNKVYYRRESWDSSSAYWIFDEPIHTQDFWALRQYGLAFQRAARNVPIKAAYRLDLSRPQLRRDLLDGVANTLYLAGNLERHLPLIHDKRDQFDEVVFRYGAVPDVSRPLGDAAAWCVAAWAMGFDGVLPWQTIGRDWAWRRADDQAVLYPGGPMHLEGPTPSLKLMALRRGQQDVEYLVQLAERSPGGAAAVRAWLNEQANQSETSLDARSLRRLRHSIGRWLDKHADTPPHQRLPPVVDKAERFQRRPAQTDEHVTRLLDPAKP